ALVGGFVVIGVFVVRDLGHVVALPAAQHLEALRGVGFALGSAALLWELGRTARHARAALVMGALGALAMALGAVLGAVAPTALGLVSVALSGLWLGWPDDLGAPDRASPPALDARWTRFIEAGSHIAWGTLLAALLLGMLFRHDEPRLNALAGLGLVAAHASFALGAWRAAHQHRSATFGTAAFVCGWVALLTLVDVVAALAGTDELRLYVGHARILGGGFSISLLALALWAIAPRDTEGRNQGIVLAVGGLVIALATISVLTVLASSKPGQGISGLALWFLLSVSYRRLRALSSRVSARLVTHDAAAAFGPEPDAPPHPTPPAAEPDAVAPRPSP
ncbi:MAG: hypothetical protein JNJ59_13300, partial [Deltaproteobacteria bacterium]|nr:hypothetical protein [Deltaproteobacteria bacterium]